MLGSLLRQKREELKLTLEDAEKGTNIRKLYIQALENEEYDKLPKAEIFCKGFLRSYGKFLGLNSEELVEIYLQDKHNLPPANKEEKAEDLEGAVEEAAVLAKGEEKPEQLSKAKPKDSIKRTKLSDFASHQQYMERKPINRKKLAVVVGLVIIVLIGLVSLISNLGSSKEVPAAAPKENTQVEKVQAAPISLAAKFTKDAQVKVLVDGSEVLSKNITKGTELTWEANHTLTIITDQPDAMVVSLNKEADHVLAKGNGKTEVIYALNNDKKIITTVNVEAKKEEAAKVEPAEKAEPPVVKQEVKQEVKKPAAPPKQEAKPVAKEAAKPMPAPAPKAEQPQPKAE